MEVVNVDENELDADLLDKFNIDVRMLITVKKFSTRWEVPTTVRWKLGLNGHGQR